MNVAFKGIENLAALSHDTDHKAIVIRNNQINCELTGLELDKFRVLLTKFKPERPGVLKVLTTETDVFTDSLSSPLKYMATINGKPIYEHYSQRQAFGPLRKLKELFETIAYSTKSSIHTPKTPSDKAHFADELIKSQGCASEITDVCDPAYIKKVAETSMKNINKFMEQLARL